MQVRRERTGDAAAIHHVNQEAFANPAEARIVDLVRAQAEPIISLVAEEDGEVAGHILFSPVTLVPRTDILIMGLAPMAVLPHRQRQGIGSALVEAGLKECRALGAVGVVVVGHPEFYPRFGFAPASQLGLKCEFAVRDEVWMAMELVNDALRIPGGMIRYHRAFSRG